MSYSKNNLNADDRGASMAEAALALIALMLVVGAIIDFGFALHQYNYLNYVTTRAAREISAKIAVSNDCSEAARFIRNAAHPEIKNAMAMGERATWTWCMTSGGSQTCLTTPNSQFKSLRLTGQLPLNCYFLCSILPKSWAVTTTVTSAIENLNVTVCPEEGPIP